MITNNKILAYICNDLQNAQDYKIDGNDCYYKNELIGEIKEELKDNVLNIYFKPITPVKYINLAIPRSSLTSIVNITVV